MEIHTASEREVLEGLLDVQRAEIQGLLEGLTEEQARRRLVPSLTTPMALVRHATFVERIWLHHRVDGVPREQLGLPETVEESFVPDPQDTIASVRSAHLAACERSREIAAQHDLDEQFAWRQNAVSLRFIYAHMIAELARHAGHGDILVEQLRAAQRPGQ